MNTVSIALTTYNGEKYLGELLNSLLSQTYPIMEIVVSDDGSSDGTLSVLGEYSARDSRIRLLSAHSNLGYVKNFELCFTHCKGEFIAPCDQDDVWLPQKVERLVHSIGDNLLIVSDAEITNANLKPSGKRLSELFPVAKQKRIDFRALAVDNQFPGCTMLVRRSLVDAAVPFPPEIPHDWWIVLNSVDANRAIYLPEALTMYRQHGENAIGVDIQRKHRVRKAVKQLLCSHHTLDRKNLKQLTRYRALLHQAKVQEFKTKNIRFLQYMTAYYRSYFQGWWNPGRLVMRFRIDRMRPSKPGLLFSTASAIRAIVGWKRPRG